MINRTSKAHWSGDLPNGTGTISTASGVLANTAYSFKTRFEQGIGTNPEELLAAAHAGCFSMALSMVLGLEGLKADSIDTSCTITLGKQGEGFVVTKSHLVLVAKIPGATEEAFIRATNVAKENCPVSKLFDTEITLDAKLV